MKHCLSCLCVLLLLLGTARGQGIVYVAPGGEGNKDGSSWDNAMGDLQAAIEEAHKQYVQSGNVTQVQVWVKAGSYTPASWPNGLTGTRNKHFSLRNGVKVIGGFAGSETTAVSTGGTTILSGDLGNGVYAYHVFYHLGNAGGSGQKLNATAMLSNVTIQDGWADVAGQRHANGRGSGMYNNDGNALRIEDCVFRNNRRWWWSLVF